MLLFRPGDPLAALLFRFGPFRFLSSRGKEKSEQGPGSLLDDVLGGPAGGRGLTPLLSSPSRA